MTLDRFATGQTDDEQLNVFADRLAALMASLVYRATPYVSLEPLVPVAHLTYCALTGVEKSGSTWPVRHQLG